MALRDWRAIAQASGIALTEGELDGVVQPLERLDQTFRPLVKDLTPDIDPVLEMDAEADGE
jgi:hypothetical protein